MPFATSSLLSMGFMARYHADLEEEEEAVVMEEEVLLSMSFRAKYYTECLVWRTTRGRKQKWDARAHAESRRRGHTPSG